MHKAISTLIVLSLMLAATEWESLDGPPVGRADDISFGVRSGEYVLYAADQTHKLYKSDVDYAKCTQGLEALL